MLGPLAQSVTARFARVVRTKNTEDIALELRQAGATFDLQAYRRSGPVLVSRGAGGPRPRRVCSWAPRSWPSPVLLAGAAIGPRRMPSHLRSLKRRRAQRVRSDLPTIAVMLAAKTPIPRASSWRSGRSPRSGPARWWTTSSGPCQLIDSGYGARAAFELASVEAVDPAAARIYRLVATATTGGIDLPAALIELAGELRAQRREEVERTAAKRQLAMTGPIVAFTVPVIALFLIVPTTALLHG